MKLSKLRELAFFGCSFWVMYAMIVFQCSTGVFFPNRHGSGRKWCFRLYHPVGAACGQHRTPTWKQWKKWNRVETQHALYSLAQMRDFQTLNLKKRVSLRWRAWIWKRACVSHHRNPKRRKHACVSLQKSKKTWKRTCVSHHNVEQSRKRACVSTLQAASRKKTRNVFKMCFLLIYSSVSMNYNMCFRDRLETRMCFHPSTANSDGNTHVFPCCTAFTLGNAYVFPAGRP